MRFLTLALSLLATCAAHAESFDLDRATITVEGFTNLAASHTADAPDGSDTAAWAFAEGRLLALAEVGSNVLIGPRIAYRGFASSRAEDDSRIGEASLIALGSWGRLEAGDRRGLPDVLTGYAPNNYQFVSAEYGPASGPSLDPDGALQTLLLPAPLGREIGALSSLGITASFFSDESTKVIYVAPKVHGFLGGVSHASSLEDVGGRFSDLTQAGLTWEHYWASHVLRVGGTYSRANGNRTSAATDTSDLRSWSTGATATFDDALTVGVSYSDDGDTGLTGLPGRLNGSRAFGWAASINYNTGQWTFGAFVQEARREGDTALPGDDHLLALQAGVSYRSSTRIRYFAAAYRYDLEDEGGAGSLGHERGTALVIGTRLSI